MGAADAKIGQEDVDGLRRYADGGKSLGELGEVGVDEVDGGVLREALAGNAEIGRVGIEADEPSAGADALKDGKCMTGEADGAVDGEVCGPGIEAMEDMLEHDRGMAGVRSWRIRPWFGWVVHWWRMLASCSASCMADGGVAGCSR